MAKKEILTDVHVAMAYSPLTVTTGLTTEGNVAGSQQLDLSTGQYTPDYTVAHLVVRPWMRIADPDGVLPGGEVELTNRHWYMTESKVRRELTNRAECQIGDDGRISIRQNITAGKVKTLTFEGEYMDPRTGMIYRMSESMPVSCEVVSTPPRLTLNQRGLTEWDPTTGKKAKITLEADLKVGAESVADDKRIFVWEKKDEGDADFSPILPADDPERDLMDYDVELSADGRRLTLDRELMGTRVDIRCRAKYDPYGNPGATELTERSPEARATFTRNIPTPRAEALGCFRPRPGQTTLEPEAVVYIGQRLLTDAENWFDVAWYTAKGNAQGTLARSLAGHGLRPRLSVGGKVDPTYGGTLSIGLTEKDPPCAALDDDGSVLTDEDGSILII